MRLSPIGIEPLVFVRHTLTEPFSRKIAQLSQWIKPWFWPDIGLGAKMMTIVIIGVAALLGIFAYLGTVALTENTDQMLQERVTMARVTANYIDHVLASIENILKSVASQDDWVDLNQPQTSLSRVYPRLSFFAHQLFLVDSQGQLLTAYPSTNGTIPTQNFLSMYDAMAGNDFVVSRTGDGASISPIALSPIRDTSGKIIASLGMTIAINSPNIRAFSNTFDLGRTGYMDLVDHDGVILASTRQERLGVVSDYATTIHQMISASHQTVMTCQNCYTATPDARPQNEILAFVPLERAEWGIAIWQSEEEVLANLRLLQLRIFAVMAVALIGALMLVYLTTRSVIHPVQELTTAARRISAGDLDTPIQVYGHDEIAVLAHSFDSMRVRLEEWNRELDTRVQERTAALQRALEENERLYLELQRKEQMRGELLHRVISAQEEERKRISRELHDDTCQLLTGLSYTLENAADAESIEEMRPLLEKIHTLTDTTLEEVHRIILDLRPSMLDHFGLVPALHWYAETRLDGQGIRFEIREEGDPRRLPPNVETALFRVSQEAINNIAQHAHARNAHFVFQYIPEKIQACISDDGVGFDVACIKSDGYSHLGLMSMEERVGAMGGTFSITTSPGQGTTIRLRVPLPASQKISS